MSFIEYVSSNYEFILQLLLQHIQLSLLAVLVAILVGIPLAIIISDKEYLSKPVTSLINIVQAIPSMAALGFMIPIFGIGSKPAIIMVMLYALLPIVKNATTGLRGINPQTLEAAKGIGMTRSQILMRIRLPLAMPVIMAGVRISAVSSVGLMTIASYIGAGGLGYLIYSGVQMVNTNMILAGAIPACILALSMDWIFSRVENFVTPLSLRKKAKFPNSLKEVEKRQKHRKAIYVSVATLLCIIIVTSTINSVAAKSKEIVVSSKNYTEQILLGNMTADIIEGNTDFNVVRKLGLGGTDISLKAITSGETDVQVDYTGTIYASVLKHSPDGSTVQEVFDTVKDEYHKDYNLEVLPSWGFNNTYALAVRKETAEKYGLKTISDLKKVSNTLRLTPTFEFANREDGLIGLQKVYDMEFGEVIPMEGGLKYSAIDNDECDIIVAFTTDALCKEYDLVVLEDDKSFFLPYMAVPVIREDVAEKYPEVKEALNKLTDELNDEIMRDLNYKIDVLEQKPEDVSKEFLKENGYIK